MIGSGAKGNMDGNPGDDRLSGRGANDVLTDITGNDMPLVRRETTPSTVALDGTLFAPALVTIGSPVREKATASMSVKRWRRRCQWRSELDTCQGDNGDTLTSCES